MAKPTGINWLVLEAIGKAQGDSSHFALDSEISVVS